MLAFRLPEFASQTRDQALRFAFLWRALFWPHCSTFLNEHIKLVQIDRLDEVMLESCIVTFTDIIFHSETGQSDGKERPSGRQLLNQLDSAAIGQSEIADEHLKFRFRCEFERRLKSAGRLHIISAQ